MLPPSLSGYLLIECEGGYPETFLNAAAAQQIPLWNVRRQDLSLLCRTYAVHYRRLRHIARRAQVRMRIRKKSGIFFAVRRRGLRLGIPVGMLAFFIILSLLSSRVWVIRVHGNETLSSQEICAVLAPLGIREGTNFNDVDLADVRLSALQQLPQLTWLTVNREGSILTVEVKERTQTEPIADDQPANLVAACDGVIVQMHTAVGQPIAKTGDAVRRGDLLISGVTESRVGPQLKRAVGSVTARTTRTLCVSVPFAEEVKIPSRSRTRTEISILGLRIPLYTPAAIADTPTVITKTHALTANGVELPLRVTHTEYRYTTTTCRTHTAEEALAIAEERLSQEETLLSEFFCTEQRTVSVRSDEVGITLIATLIGTEEIAVSAPIK